jgi:hypothetical protein
MDSLSDYMTKGLACKGIRSLDTGYLVANALQQRPSFTLPVACMLLAILSSAANARELILTLCTKRTKICQLIPQCLMS